MLGAPPLYPYFNPLKAAAGTAPRHPKEQRADRRGRDGRPARPTVESLEPRVTVATAELGTASPVSA
jgi:hypothetical protein